MDPIKELDTKLKEMIKSREAFSKHVDRAALKEYVSTLVSDTRGTVEALSEIATPTMGAAFKKLISDSKGNATKAYEKYLGLLKKANNKNAALAEDKIPFASLVEAGKRELVVLTELESKIDELFSHNTINIFNGRLSHIVVIGLLSEAKMLAKYSKYLLSAVVSSVTNQPDIAKYRYIWLDEYSEATAEMVSKLMSGKDSYDFDTIIKDMQTKAVDVTLIDDFNQVTVDMVNSSKVSSDAKGIIASGVKKLGMFRWLGEIWATHKIEKVEEQRRQVEWMRAHTELLRMKLEDIDEESPEYKRLVKIIERYEEMISKADKKAQRDEA